MVLYGVFKILIKMLFYLDLSGKNLRAKNLKQKLHHQVVEAEALKVEAEAIQKIAASTSLFLTQPIQRMIFYFKYNVGASLIIIFVGNPDVDNFGDAILVTS